MARVALVRDLARKVAQGNRRVLLEAAEEAAEEARRRAPVATGAYRDGIAAVSAEVDGAPVGRVVARDWKSALVEFGFRGRTPEAPLRRAAETLGFKVRRNAR